MTPDRTKAIVEAAEELAAALRLTLLRDADGRPFAIQHYDFADAKVRSPAGAALRMLADALDLPSPRWTRTPPSEPGYYFWREWLPEQTAVGTPPMDIPGGWYDDVVDVQEKHIWSWPSEWEGREWWPVRIEEPPST